MFQIDLEDRVFDAVFAYGEQVMPERPVQDAVRELLVQATANDARDGAIRGARIQAYREARDTIFSEIATRLAELARSFGVRGFADQGEEPLAPPANNAVGESL